MSTPHPFEEAIKIRQRDLKFVLACRKILTQYDYEIPLPLDLLAAEIMRDIEDLKRKPQIIAAKAAKRLLA